MWTELDDKLLNAYPDRARALQLAADLRGPLAVAQLKTLFREQDRFRTEQQEAARRVTLRPGVEVTEEFFYERTRALMNARTAHCV